MASSSSAHHWLPRLVRLLSTAGILSLAVQPVAGAPPVIDVSVVPLYVGQEVTVEAVVKAGRREGNVVRLQLGQAPPSVDLVLVEGLLSRFPAHAEKDYLGKTVRASGPVREFRGRWEIVVRDPQNIALVEKSSQRAAASSESTVQASPGLPPPDWQQKWAAFEARLLSLEAKLQDIEATRTLPSPAPAEASESCEERLRKLEFRLRQLERTVGGRH